MKKILLLLIALGAVPALAQNINPSTQLRFVAPPVAYSVVFTGTTATGNWNAAAGPGTLGYPLVSGGAGTLPAFTNNLNTNIGIGVAPSPWSQGKAIEVGFAGAGVFAFNATHATYSSNYYYNAADKFAGTGFVTQYDQNNGVHNWYTSTASGTAGGTATLAANMTLSQPGKLTIGPPSLQQTTIYGDANFTYLGNTTAVNSEYIAMRAATNNVLIGVNNSAALDIQAGANGMKFTQYGAGTLTTNASGVITAISDSRKKDTRGEFTRGIDALKGWKPILYTWKKDSGMADGVIYAGFGAQDVLPHIPEAVHMGKDGFYSVSDRPIIMTTVNAVKELSARSESQNKRIAKLEKHIATLEAAIARGVKPTVH